MVSYAEKPIKIPGHPFWNVFKRFGRDEFIALITNLVGTFIVYTFWSNPLLLALAGPILEKIGFFPAHFYEGWVVYKTSPPHKRKSLGQIVSSNFLMVHSCSAYRAIRKPTSGRGSRP